MPLGSHGWEDLISKEESVHFWSLRTTHGLNVFSSDSKLEGPLVLSCLCLQNGTSMSSAQGSGLRFVCLRFRIGTVDGTPPEYGWRL